VPIQLPVLFLLAFVALAGDFTYIIPADTANGTNLDITHGLGSTAVIVQCTTAVGVTIPVSVPDAQRTTSALRVRMPSAGGPFNGKCYLSGGAGGTSGTTGDLLLTKTSGSVISVAAGRYGVNSDTYLEPATTFTILSMPIVSLTLTNPVRFSVSLANYQQIIDGDMSMIIITGGTGCSAVGGLHTLTKYNNPTQEIELFPAVNATGCTGLTGTVQGTGSGTCYLEGTDDGLVRARCPSASGVLLSCTGNCTYIQEAIPEFNADNVKIGTVTLAGGTPSTWDVVTETRGILHNRRVIPSDGLQFDATQTMLSVTGNVAKRNGGNVFTGPQDFSASSVTGISGGPGGGGMLVAHQGQQTGFTIPVGSEVVLRSASIPANTLAAGECLEISASGVAPGATGNVSYKLYWGTTGITMWTTTSLGPHRFMASVCYDSGSTTNGMMYGVAMAGAGDGYLRGDAAPSTAFSLAASSANNLELRAQSADTAITYTMHNWTITKLKY
jgi:hypothetical protein